MIEKYIYFKIIMFVCCILYVANDGRRCIETIMGVWFAINHQCVVCFFFMMDVQLVANNGHKLMKDDRNGAWN